MKVTIFVDDKKIFSFGRNRFAKKEVFQMAKYSALSIAWYIVDYVQKMEEDQTITNLKLQKIMYFLQAQFLKTNKTPLFSDNIEAWKYGPVIDSVYSYYCEYMNRPINDDFEPSILLTADEQELINSIVDDFISDDEWDLVEITHNQDPWVDNYEKGVKHKIIPVQDIIAYFETRNLREIIN